MPKSYYYSNSNGPAGIISTLDQLLTLNARRITIRIRKDLVISACMKGEKRGDRVLIFK